ncbi:MAG: 30S ribosomal protein S14 [Kordiimonadaceae bacterium]|jgi:small subunit ribosomal protein S14|nr:30S ribosomal protein S14 [Kordiimonadaceae bacterium]MBT7605935.1 30S ribosomal protein S14 [Kordiimonadaceae bacterium]MDC0082145.1 30S ribosomal protein S14 [Emcibacteraceae bacterium]MDC1428565.1 30S ribosomal protein S14 [Emcibacteraceae bacterium]|tara:strand:+ start:6514 stop:6819 length:306 start_codon:yes stop_codon:yes gene_type:complete
MAKVSAVNKNLKRVHLVAKYAEKRAALKAAAKDPNLSFDEQFVARLKLAKLPRNSAKVRIRNRCQVTGRPRGYHRKFKMSRVSLRHLASNGYLPGVVKSSW